METREILQDIISDFSPDKFTRFFREKNRSFAPRQESFTHYNDECFADGMKLGEIKFSESEQLVVCSFKANHPLTERSGKKAQYEKGKKILREMQYDAGIFIFYDRQGNLRFSLIYANYQYSHRDWSAFRRFTYFVSNSKEYTNKTFLQRVGDGDFSTLETVKDAFSVDKVTKEFYKDIANWYFWAVQNTIFPKDAENEENGRNIAVIRLITRMIFIWFMRECGLVRKEFFIKDRIAARLKDLSPDKTTYYKAILQNLFFSTLNTKISKRTFRFSKSFQGKNKSYMDHGIYRYEEYFKNRDDMLEIFRDIPFLNGGLFECLDTRTDENGKNMEIRVDGFSDKELGLQVPNRLFFSDELDTDLNKEYGTKDKKYKVRGLLDILTSYNFTIDENDPNDQEVALDPELLGKVFENLLASFNPETSSTARKATGSYYTPREIVDYMVTESLKQYLKTHLDGTDELERKLDDLFSPEKQANPFDGQVQKVIGLIDDLRIVDPAVGSGAFPMGILNKLVFILGKLDPQNTLWKQAQLNAVAKNITDPIVRKKLEEQIEEQFSSKNSDYGRKLYLIQKCIYGVDIQRIAVEIAKLRFFISLLVDEKIDKAKENWDIEPLPNLDYKIMQGNSLLEEYDGINLFDERLLESLVPANDRQIDVLEKQEKEIHKLIMPYYQKNPILMKNGQMERPMELDRLESELKRVQLSLKYEREFRLPKNTGQIALLPNDQNAFKIREMLETLHKEFFATTDKNEKNELKRQIEQLEWELIEATLRDQNKISALKKIEEFKKSNAKPFFLWKLHFAEVFKEKGGFDIVIANPPYIGEKGHKEIFREIKKGNLYRFYIRKMDLFYFFFHLALNLGKNNASIAFITTNYFPTATGGKKLRQDFKDRATISNLVNLNELKIFESALGQHNMITLLRKDSDENAITKTCITKRKGDVEPEILQAIVDWNDVETDYFRVIQKDLYDGEECYIRLVGNARISSNTLQLILEKIKNQGNRLDSICNVNQGLRTGADKVTQKHIREYKLKRVKNNEGIFILSKNEISNLKLNSFEKTKLKPLFKNSDISKYYCKTESAFALIDLFWPNDRDVAMNQIKNMVTHLQKYREILTNRRENANGIDKAIAKGIYWFASVRRKLNFDREKIVSPQRSKTNIFGYNTIPWYASADVYFITAKDNLVSLKYILSLLNSKLYYLWLYYRGKRKGETLELYQKPLSEIPVKKISKDEQKPFIDIVDRILAITQADDYLQNPAKQAKVKEYERQIDQMVYKLYNLTPEEINIVESNGR